MATASAPHFSSSDLLQLQCPFQSSDASACARQQTGAHCPFGHQTTDQSRSALCPIGDFCPSHLLGECTNELYKSDEGHPLKWCKSGFHPQDLFELKRIDADLSQREFSLKSAAGKRSSDGKNSGDASASQDESSISSSSSAGGKEFNGPAENPTARCLLCGKLVVAESRQPYGLLEFCRCPFCFNCISEHRNGKSSEACPVCQTDSQRILIWPFWLSSPKMKQQLLDAQQSCFPGRSTVGGDNLFDFLPDRYLIFLLATMATILAVMALLPQ